MKTYKIMYNNQRKSDLDISKTRISDTINLRMKLQSVQKNIRVNFNIDPDFNNITSSKFLSNYKNWDEIKKHHFLMEIGGPMNFEKTKRYFNFLDKQYSNNN